MRGGILALNFSMPQESAPDVTILVPALNEENTIHEVISRLLALPLSMQIVVIDDGSTDRTPEILASFGEKIEVITNPTPGGKGRAIRKGLAVAKGKTVVIQDADLEYVPEELPSLVNPILNGNEEVVYGTRFAKGMHSGMALPNKIANWLLRAEVFLLFGKKITDEATCYKAFRQGVLEQMNLECERFEFCPEVTAKAIRLKKRILEVPITYEPRTIEAGKKIRWTDGVEAFWTLLKHRFKKF